MTDVLRLAILHCHGSGNDFPLVDARVGASAGGVADAAWPGIARALASRAGPVGGDGLLLLTDGDAAHDFGMRMFNPDGSESEQCLNGLRCVARAGLEATGRERARVRLLCSSADVWAEPELAPGVRTIGERAGPVGLDVRAWPMATDTADADGRLVDAPVPPLDPARRFTAVAMPNPHLVSFVDAVDEAELVRLGERCEAAPAWLPRRANVSFAQLRGPDALFVRTFERGVGLTESCGSAMAAACVAAALTGRLAWDRPATVWNAGGRVRGCAGSDGAATIAGNATWEWQGEVSVDPARAAASDLAVLRRFDAETAAWARALA